MLSLDDEWRKWWCCLCRLINLDEALIVPGQMFPTPYFGFISFYVLFYACVVLLCVFYVSFWTHVFSELTQPDLCYCSPYCFSAALSLKPGTWKLYCIFFVTWHCMFELQECGGSALFPRQGTVRAHQGLQLSNSLNSR